MPFVIVRILKGRSPEQKLAAARAIESALTEFVGATPESISVVFDEYNPTDWLRPDSGKLEFATLPGVETAPAPNKESEDGLVPPSDNNKENTENA